MTEISFRCELPGNVLSEIMILNACNNAPEFELAMDERVGELIETYAKPGTGREIRREYLRTRWSKDKLYNRLKITWGSDPGSWGRGRFTLADIEDLIVGKWIKRGSELHIRLQNAVVLQNRVLMHGPIVYTNPHLEISRDIKLSDAEVDSCISAAVREALRRTESTKIIREEAIEEMVRAAGKEIVATLRGLDLYVARELGRIAPDSGTMRVLPADVSAAVPYQIYDPKTRALCFVYQIAASYLSDELAATHDSET